GSGASTLISAGVGANVTGITENSTASALTVSGQITLANSVTKTLTNSNTALFTVSGGTTGGNASSILDLKNNSTTTSGITISTGSGSGSVLISGGVGSAVTSITQNGTSPLNITTTAITVASGGTTLTLSTTSPFTVSGGVTGTGDLILRNNAGSNNALSLITTLVNNTGTISNTGTGGDVLISAAIGSNVTAITENSSGYLSISGPITTASTLTLTNSNSSGSSLLLITGGFSGTGNLVLNNNSSITNGITLATNSVNNTGTITNSGSGSGRTLISADFGSNITQLIQNTTTSILELSGSNGSFTNANGTLVKAGTIYADTANAFGTGSVTLGFAGTASPVAIYANAAG
ncbi:MAG: hypothetical protein EBU45_06275, partial [Actinobacteria bacterium]|nr:hypothetical protein [Actinomycetota bacterium]